MGNHRNTRSIAMLSLVLGPSFPLKMAVLLKYYEFVVVH